MKTVKVADILSDKIKQAQNAGLDVEIKGFHWVHEAMREACSQCFDLAADNLPGAGDGSTRETIRQREAIRKFKTQIK